MNNIYYNKYLKYKYKYLNYGGGIDEIIRSDLYELITKKK